VPRRAHNTSMGLRAFRPSHPLDSGPSSWFNRWWLFRLLEQTQSTPRSREAAPATRAAKDARSPRRPVPSSDPRNLAPTFLSIQLRASLFFESGNQVLSLKKYRLTESLFRHSRNPGQSYAARIRLSLQLAMGPILVRGRPVALR
jgi:hypothetical protein